MESQAELLRQILAHLDVIKHKTELAEEESDVLMELETLSDLIHYMGSEEHQKHHRWLEAEIKKKEEWAELWKAAREKVVTGSIGAFFVGLGLIVWYAFTQFISNGGQ